VTSLSQIDGSVLDSPNSSFRFSKCCSRKVEKTLIVQKEARGV
jgi:hypothetical protein